MALTYDVYFEDSDFLKIDHNDDTHCWKGPDYRDPAV